MAIVTGAASGLGAVIAHAFQRAGYRIAVADIDFEKASEVACRIDPSGESAIALALDVTKKADFEKALSLLVQRWDAVQVLVNNAALTVAQRTMEITPDEFDAVLAVNVRGTFQGSQVFGAHFVKNGHGRIINMTSLAGQNGGTTAGAHYSASKAAIVALTKVFARDLGKDGVTVNAIAPGPLDLPQLHALVSAERLAELRAAIPVGKVGDPNFVAGMVVQLAAPDASFVTGATWDVNGGIYMR